MNKYAKEVIESAIKCLNQIDEMDKQIEIKKRLKKAADNEINRNQKIIDEYAMKNPLTRNMIEQIKLVNEFPNFRKKINIFSFISTTAGLIVGIVAFSGLNIPFTLIYSLIIFMIRHNVIRNEKKIVKSINVGYLQDEIATIKHNELAKNNEIVNKKKIEKKQYDIDIKNLAEGIKDLRNLNKNLLVFIEKYIPNYTDTIITNEEEMKSEMSKLLIQDKTKLNSTNKSNLCENTFCIKNEENNIEKEIANDSIEDDTLSQNKSLVLKKKGILI